MELHIGVRFLGALDDLWRVLVAFSLELVHMLPDIFYIWRLHDDASFTLARLAKQRSKPQPENDGYDDRSHRAFIRLRANHIFLYYNSNLFVWCELESRLQRLMYTVGFKLNGIKWDLTVTQNGIKYRDIDRLNPTVSIDGYRHRSIFVGIHRHRAGEFLCGDLLE